MDGETLKSRLAVLIQKSRRAVRLYSGVERTRERGENAEYSAMQLDQWQQVNNELLRQLCSADELANNRALSHELFVIRDRFYNDWRASEAEMRTKQRELQQASENSDFIRAAVLSRSLVALKARVQATDAAHHEVQEILERAKVPTPEGELAASIEKQAVPPQAEELTTEIQKKPAPRIAKVIPLRSRAS